MSVVHRLEEPTPAGAGLRFLIYQAGRHVFTALDGGESRPATEVHVDGLVVACAADTALPLWRLPTDWLPADLPADNWSVRVARTRSTGELYGVLADLPTNQAVAVLETLPDGLLHEWTGRPWPRDTAAALYRLALARYQLVLVMAGKQTEQYPADPGAFLDISGLVDVHRTDTTPGHWVALADLGVAASVAMALTSSGIGGLFLHQALARQYLIESRETGADLILTTPTASGKTYGFLPGILEDLLERGGTALLVYPLRALTLDQYGKIERIVDHLPPGKLRVKTFFGSDKLEQVFREGNTPNLLVATPDKLNHHLDKPAVRRFLGEVRYLVLDEAHTYRGYFGINMALLLRRLLYLTATNVRLILSSATLDNTVAFARRLSGRARFRVVGASGAPGHARYFYLAREARKSRTQVHNLFHHLVATGVRQHDGREEVSKGLVFVRSRTATLKWARRFPREEDAPGRVDALFSGMKDYRKILDTFRDGKKPHLLFSTTTLEAGVDIGDLGHVAIMGFPGSRNSFKQMAGRAGRTGAAHVILFPGTTPADQYYAEADNLRQLAGAVADPVHVNPANSKLLAAHLERMRYEASRAGRSHAEPCLDHLLAPTALEPAVRAPLREELLPLLDGAPLKVDAPPLRAIPSDVFVVVRGGEENDPDWDIRLVELSSEGEPPDWFLDLCTPEVAHREWAPGFTVIRGEQFHAVRDWVEGEVIRDGWRLDATLIRVADITETLATPEALLRAVVDLDNPQIPPHYHEGRLNTYANLQQVLHETELGFLHVEAGPGQVSVKLDAQVLRSELRARYLCTAFVASQPVQASEAHQVMPWACRNSGGEWETVPHDDDWRRGRVERETGFTTEGLVVVDREVVGDRVCLATFSHVFNNSEEGRCACGERTQLYSDWLSQWEASPAGWDDHPVFSPISRRFRTDVAVLRFDEGTDTAAVALANALVKALPNVLEVEPDDVGYALFEDWRKPEGAAPDDPAEFQGYVLLIFDMVEGGTGIATRVPEALPAILDETLRLLRVNRQCRCPDARRAEGCFGCILAFRRLSMQTREESEMEGGGPAEALTMLERILLPAVENEPAKAPETVTPSPELQKPRIRRLILDLDNLLLDTRAITNRKQGRPETWQAHSHSVAGMAETLARILRLPVELVIATNAPEDYARALVEHHFPDHARRLLRHLVTAANKRVDRVPRRLQALAEGFRSDEILLVGDEFRDVRAAQLLGIGSALGLWLARDIPGLLNVGPDLLLREPAALLEVLFDPVPFQHPFEQTEREETLWPAPLTIHRHGQDYRVLGRYFSLKVAKSARQTLAARAAGRLMSFKHRGTDAATLARYLSRQFPAHTITVIPPRPGGDTVSGLALLRRELRALDHPVDNYLDWARVPESRQKEVHGHAERIANVAGCFRTVAGLSTDRPVLLVDDVLTTGATLESAATTLAASGYQVECLAVAYTANDRPES